MNAPLCGIYASLGNSSTILGDGHGNPNAANIAKLARWQDVILDLGPAIEQPRIIAALRAANPAIRIHSYVVLKAYDWPGVFFQAMFAKVTELAGFLYATDGSMWRDSNINLARGDVVREVARVIAYYMPLTNDPLFLDVCCPGMPNATASGVDWGRAGFVSERQFMDAWAMGHAALMQAIRYYYGRPDLMISGNCGTRSHADVNGWMREAFPSQSGGTWESNMVEYVEPNGTRVPGLLNEVYREPRASWLCSEPLYSYTSQGRAWYNPMAQENERRHRYGLASACLGGAYHSFGRYESDPVWCRERLNFWYPEYSHPKLGKGWLGEPTSAAMLSGAVWMRDFQRGLVICNPSPRAQSVYLSKLYQPIGGTAKTAFSVPPHDALILEAV